MTKTEEARRLASELRSVIPPKNHEASRILDSAAFTLRLLAADVNKLEAELAETKEGWRLAIEQHRVNVMPETESAVHIAELETEITRLSSEVDRHEAARFAVDTELSDWMDYDGPGALCAIRKLKAENEALRAALESIALSNLLVKQTALVAGHVVEIARAALKAKP